MKDLLLTNHKTESILFAIVAAYLCIWLFIFSGLDGFPVFGQDAGRYIVLAENLLDKGSFTFDGETPEVFRTPGVPALLALSKWLTGAFLLASFFNIFFSASLAVIIFLIARRFLSESLSIAASIIFSLSPQVIFHSVGVFGEMPFTFFFILSVWLLFFKEGRGKKEIFLAGLSLGIAALIRPVALYFLPLLLIFLIYECWRNKKNIALLFIGFLIIAGPWMLRNKIVGGSFSLSSIGAYNLAHYNAALYLESRFGKDSPESQSYQAKLRQVPNDEGKLFSEKEILTSLAKGVIMENKISYITFHIVESTKFFLSSGLRYVVLHIEAPRVQAFFGLNVSSPDLLNLLRNFRIKEIAGTLFSQSLITLDRLIMLFLTVAAILAISFKRSRFHVLILLALIAYLALLTGPVSIPRYRLPVEPLIIILSLYSLKEMLTSRRLKNIFIFLLCILKIPFSGASRKIPGDPRRILIIQRAQLGDLVCTTPMLKAAKLRYPRAKIILCGKESYELLMDNHPYVDEYMSFNDDEFFDAVKSFRARDIDFVAIASPDFHGLAATYLAGIKCIAVPEVTGGYTPYETITYKILRKFAITKPFAMGAYAPRERLRLLEPLEIISDDTTKTLGVGKEAQQSVHKWLQERGLGENSLLVGMALAAGNKIKEWPVERFGEVARHLIQKYGAKIIVVGAPIDVGRSEEFLSLVDSPNAYDTAGLFNLEELKALIAKVELFISVDTGPLYIAEAFNVPTVDIIGPLDEREQPPIGEMHARVIAKDRGTPSIHIMNTRVVDIKEVRRQTEAITAEMVIRVADALIARLKLK